MNPPDEVRAICEDGILVDRNGDNVLTTLWTNPGRMTSAAPETRAR